MKGTAILIHPDLTIKVIEHIDLIQWSNTCDGDIFQNKQDVSKNNQIYLLESEIDWEYGY